MIDVVMIRIRDMSKNSCLAQHRHSWLHIEILYVPVIDTSIQRLVYMHLFICSVQ